MLSLFVLHSNLIEQWSFLFEWNYTSFPDETTPAKHVESSEREHVWDYRNLLIGCFVYTYVFEYTVSCTFMLFLKMSSSYGMGVTCIFCILPLKTLIVKIGVFDWSFRPVEKKYIFLILPLEWKQAIWLLTRFSRIHIEIPLSLCPAVIFPWLKSITKS